MSKVGRAGGRDSTKGAKSRRTSKPKGQPANNKAANWAAAQLRAARNRASYALRLGALTAALLAALAVAALAVLGRLGETGEMIASAFEQRLTQSGYTVAWLDISGAERLDAQTLAELIGARPGAGLAEIDLDATRAALEAHGWVKSAEVLRYWPDRIAVLIEEREPVALWQIEGVHHVLDRDGAVIEAADPAEFATLPRVVGAGANEGAALITSLIAHHEAVNARVTHAIKVGERRWSLRLASGGEVLLPEADPAGALATLAALHEERAVLDYDVQFIDLRNDGEMVIRPWPDRAEQVAGRGA